jgi:hypothetical protein
MKKNIKKIIYIESKPSFLDQHSIMNEDLLKLNNEFYYLKKKISSTGIIYNVLGHFLQTFLKENRVSTCTNADT